MKVFKRDVGGDYDLVAGESMEQAKEFYLNSTGVRDDKSTEWSEVPTEEIDEMDVYDEAFGLTWKLPELIYGLTQPAIVATSIF